MQSVNFRFSREQLEVLEKVRKGLQIEAEEGYASGVYEGFYPVEVNRTMAVKILINREWSRMERNSLLNQDLELIGKKQIKKKKAKSGSEVIK